ncbi:short coiled-coil protein isoform X2 [Tetranychus urticae]|uniref:Short coiled-coil protein A n=1 Tax=Tetranychus urticae TaxID=32264 RepID=T1KN20_TETUR|nr:short coiled-coil protein isoform X2 [Tetranychus urticae]
METSFKGLADDLNNIPLADEDAPDEEESDDEGASRLDLNHSLTQDPSFDSLGSNDQQTDINSFDPEMNKEEIEERERLIQQVLELQNTLDDLSLRVDGVKEENLKLKSENQVLSQYIEDLMSASTVFQSTSPNVSKKRGKL